MSIHHLEYLFTICYFENMKKTPFLFVILLFPLFSISSESVVSVNKMSSPSFSNRNDRTSRELPSDLIETVFEEGEEEEEKSSEENLSHSNCLSGGYCGIHSDFCLYFFYDSSSSSRINLILPLLRAPPCYS